ncbi:MAG: class I SAM-dependent methyltransferase [Sphingobacteriaceae bacterium]
MGIFHDIFSKQASNYARFRPSYPHELYDFLNSLTPGHDLAWDCGTGNGQAAIHLADFFTRVHASDPNEAQIANAFVHESVHYKIERADQPDISDRSVDLITVAQAIHWFDIESFYAAAKRVMKPHGILAIWAYSLPQILPKIDKTILGFRRHTLGPYWPQELHLLDQEYTTISFPFREIEPPEFYIRKRLSLDDLIGHIRSWSATEQFIQQEGFDPMPELKRQLISQWGEQDELKIVSWKLMLRVGKVPGG